MSLIAASTRRYKVGGALDQTQAHTLSFWAKTSSQGGASDATLSNVGASGDFAQFYIDSGGIAIFSEVGGNRSDPAAVFTGMDFYTLVWPVIAGTAVTPDVYLNGVSANLSGSPVPWNVAADPGSALWLLCTPGGEQPPDGWEMANIILNLTALSGAQITAQMASESPVATAAGWWKCRNNLLNSIGGGTAITMDAGAAGFGTYDPFPPAAGGSGGFFGACAHMAATAIKAFKCRYHPVLLPEGYRRRPGGLLVPA